MKIVKFLLGAALALAASAAFAQTIKIGFITSYSGLNGNLGPYMERAVRLYIKEHQKELPPGLEASTKFTVRGESPPHRSAVKSTTDGTITVIPIVSVLVPQAFVAVICTM